MRTSSLLHGRYLKLSSRFFKFQKRFNLYAYRLEHAFETIDDETLDETGMQQVAP